jgi:hypothetical protein
MDTESGSAVEVFRSVSVPLAQARAFELFTTRMTEFWPKEHSIGESEVAIFDDPAGWTGSLAAFVDLAAAQTTPGH